MGVIAEKTAAEQKIDRAAQVHPLFAQALLTLVFFRMLMLTEVMKEPLLPIRKRRLLLKLYLS